MSVNVLFRWWTSCRVESSSRLSYKFNDIILLSMILYEIYGNFIILKISLSDIQKFLEINNILHKCR